MIHKKNFLTAAVLISLLLTGCGKDEALEKYYSEMEAFVLEADNGFDALNSIDPSSETAVEDMLTALDGLAVSFQTLADIEVPNEFSANESLADEAASYMAEAAELYREAYADGTYYSNVAEAAQENYSRAVKRMEYISMILQGEMPTDESITIITETGS